MITIFTDDDFVKKPRKTTKDFMPIFKKESLNAYIKSDAILYHSNKNGWKVLKARRGQETLDKLTKMFKEELCLKN